MRFLASQQHTGPAASHPGGRWFETSRAHRRREEDQPVRAGPHRDPPLADVGDVEIGQLRPRAGPTSN